MLPELPRCSTRLAAAIGFLLAVAGSAAAHVAPSDRDNNRYILLAPLGDRVRLAYTVFMGHEPGRRARARMDADRDGRIGEEEASAFGRQIAAQVAPRLSLEVDGRAAPIVWQEMEVGLGEPSAVGGAFAVDLVAWACFAQPQDRPALHRLRFTDRFHIEDPGESELRAEESPGVHILRTELGQPGAPGPPRLTYRWMGGPGPAESGAYRLEFEVDPAVATFLGGTCDAPGPGRRWPWTIAAAALLAAGLALRAIRRGRSVGDSPRRPPSDQKMNG